MDLKIKKFYIEQEEGGSTVERKLIVESKFRRETSNFKVNFDLSSVDPTSRVPVLIEYIEKNLKPEELLGLVVARTVSAPNHPTVGGTGIIVNVEAATDETRTDFVYYALYASDSNAIAYYVPSTGALSLNGPYVEEEEGGDDGEGEDIPPVSPFTPGVNPGNNA